MQLAAAIVISLAGWGIVAQSAPSQNPDHPAQGDEYVLRLSANAGCPAGFRYSTDGARCYKIISEAMTWDEARSRCLAQASGAHLLTVTDSGTNTAVYKMLQNFQYYDSETFNNTCRSYFWTSGRQLTDDCKDEYFWQPSPNVTIPMTYRNWLWNEPNCSGGNHHCLHYKYVEVFKGWNDDTCTAKMCAICEYR